MSRWLIASNKRKANIYDLDTGGEPLEYVWDDPINMRSHKNTIPNTHNSEHSRSSGYTDKYIDPMYDICVELDGLRKQGKEPSKELKEKAIELFNKMEYYSKEKLITWLRFDEVLSDIVDDLNYDVNTEKLNTFLNGL